MGNAPQNRKLCNTRNWGVMHSEFACKFIVWSNHDHSTLEITFGSAQNLFCSHHRIKNCPTLEIGVQYIQNLHANSWRSQIMTTLVQKLLLAVHRNITRYFHFGPMVKQINPITATLCIIEKIIFAPSLTCIMQPCIYTYRNRNNASDSLHNVHF